MVILRPYMGNNTPSDLFWTINVSRDGVFMNQHFRQKNATFPTFFSRRIDGLKLVFRMIAARWCQCCRYSNTKSKFQKKKTMRLFMPRDSIKNYVIVVYLLLFFNISKLNHKSSQLILNFSIINPSFKFFF